MTVCLAAKRDNNLFSTLLIFPSKQKQTKLKNQNLKKKKKKCLKKKEKEGGNGENTNRKLTNPEMNKTERGNGN